MGTKIVVAKLTRLTLPRGAFGAASIAGRHGPETRIYCHEGSALYVFCIEGESSYTIRELEDIEAVGMQNLADDMKEAHGVDLHPDRVICMDKPVVIITDDGWELYPDFRYYAEGETVVSDPERGIAHEMAEIMWRRNDLQFEAAEISESARACNIHLSLALLQAAAESIPNTVPAPAAGGVH